MKILGFVFGERPSVYEHINYVCQKFKKAIWSVTHIKRAGIDTKTMITVYCSMLRPIIEFCSPVYHSLLTEELDKKLEDLQKMALKLIYGFNISYDNLLQKAGISSLKARREAAFLNFTKSLLLNDRYVDWFPVTEDTHVNLRNKKHYTEFYARTERMYNSPLYSMRRAMNRLYNEEE